MERRLGAHARCVGIRAVCAMAAVVSGGCASAGTPAPAYQITTHTDARPPLAPPVASVLAPSADAGGASGPPSLPPAQSTIVGMPSTHVNVNASGNDVAEVIAGVARQVGLRAVIDPGIHGPITTMMQNVSVNDAMTRLVGNRYQFRVQNGALVVSPIQLVQQTYEVSYLQMARSSQASTVVARNLTGASNSGIITNPSGAGTGVSNTSSGLVASGTDVIQSSSNSDVWGELKVGLRTILFSGRTDSSGRTGPNAGSSAIGGASASGDCYEGTCLNISPFANLVTVTATPEKQQLVADWLNLFKASITRQVYITAKVVEVTLDRTKSYGIDWQAVLTTAKTKLSFTTTQSAFPTAAEVLVDPTKDITSTNNASFNLGLGDLGLKAVINALQSTGDVNVLASPATSAMNQQKASFNVTRDVPFVTVTQQPIFSPTTGQIQSFQPITNVQTAQVGIILDVLPQISSDNVITMSIRPSVTSLVTTQVIATAGGGQTLLPITDRRETDTMARVRSGETIMIGGLIQTQTTSDRHGIPVLMNLPGLGHLFSHVSTTEHHSEMVIFITPQIVSGQPPGAP
jgi:MSHA type pilus biogenesis protein MshL